MILTRFNVSASREAMRFHVECPCFLPAWHLSSFGSGTKLAAAILAKRVSTPDRVLMKGAHRCGRTRWCVHPQETVSCCWTRSNRHEPLAGWYTVVSIKVGEPGSVLALAYPLAADTIVCFQMKASTTPAHPPQQVPCASPGGGALCCASPSGGPRLEFAPRQLSALLGPAAVAPAVLLQKLHKQNARYLLCDEV